jgi:uncharacterized protein YjiK
MKPILIIILLGLTLLHCGKNDASLDSNLLSLSLIDEIEIQITEPSGLSIGKQNQSLWVVSDAPDSEVFEINLQGNILRKLNFIGEDLEGVVYDSLKNVVWVVEEKKREIVEVALDGSELSRHSVSINGSANNGLEGISINASGQLWIANEKEPGLLLALNSDFSINAQIFLNFSNDYSGLSFGYQNDRIWIVSDESKLLVEYDKQSGVIKKYNLPFIKAEGVAVDTPNSIVFIIRESNSKLYTFKYLD